MEKFKTIAYKVGSSYKTLPDKKKYLEFFTAALSVPMLLTVILLNLNNLKTSKQQAQTPVPTAEPVKQIIYVSPREEDGTVTQGPTPTVIVSPTISKEECRKELPSITITNPEENATVTDNPVNIDIKLQRGDYCSVVWAYRINGGRWSDYDDKSVALYNLISGNITFELKVKSIVTGQEQLLKRNFIYNNPIAQPTTQAASASAN